MRAGGVKPHNKDYKRVSATLFILKSGFTLTEILIATGIVGIIAALVIPALVKNYQTQTLDHGFKRQYQSIRNAIDSLVINENKADFFSTSMYVNTAPDSYENSAGTFIKKYMKVNKYCGDNNGDCFAPKYYEFKNNDKVEYKPEFKGACASLKNGMSLCITPQIGNDSIVGIIDVNGKKGPNIKDKDLRTFTISPKSRIGLNTDTEEVYFTPPTSLKPDGGSSTTEPETPTTPTKTACELDQYSLDCCKTKTGSIKTQTDSCCTYEEIKNLVPICADHGDIRVKLEPEDKGALMWNINIKITAPANMDPDKMSLHIVFAYWVVGAGDWDGRTNVSREEFDEIGSFLPFTNTAKYKKANFSLSSFPGNTRGPYPVECELVYNGEVLYSDSMRMGDFIATSGPVNWNESICRTFGGSY